MAWKVNRLDQYDVIELVYSGWVTPQDLKDAFKVAFTLTIEQHLTRYLADCTELTGGHSVFDLYNLIAEYEMLDVDPGSKEAVLTSAQPEIAADVRFYETAALNRGFLVKVFHDRDKALEWLVE